MGIARSNKDDKIKLKEKSIDESEPVSEVVLASEEYFKKAFKYHEYVGETTKEMCAEFHIAGQSIGESRVLEWLRSKRKVEYEWMADEYEKRFKS